MRTLPLALAALLLTAGCTDAPSRAPRSTSPASSATPTATPVPSPSPSPSPSAAVVAAPAPSPARPQPKAAAQAHLTGDGIDLPGRLLEFGTAFAQAAPALRAALGRPTRDTGVVSSAQTYGVCPGTQLRGLEYGGGALVVLFGDVGGPGLRMYQWTLTSQGDRRGLPRARALVGDTATLDIGIGTTVAQLRAGAAEGTLTVNEGDEVFDPSFSLQDQSAGLFGRLTGTAPRDTVTSVQGGQGCGE